MSIKIRILVRIKELIKINLTLRLQCGFMAQAKIHFQIFPK